MTPNDWGNKFSSIDYVDNSCIRIKIGNGLRKHTLIFGTLPYYAIESRAGTY